MTTMLDDKPAVSLKASGGEVRRSREAANTPVVAVITLTLPRPSEDWLSLWNAMARLAEANATCRSVRFLRHRDREERYLLLTEWDSAADLARFVRTSGIHWIDVACPVRASFSVFEPVDVAQPRQ